MDLRCSGAEMKSIGQTVSWWKLHTVCLKHKPFRIQIHKWPKALLAGTANLKRRGETQGTFDAFV